MNQNRLLFALFFLCPMLFVSVLTRFLICIKEFSFGSISLSDGLVSMLNGGLSDLLTASYLLIPVIILIFFIPSRPNKKKAYWRFFIFCVYLNIVFWVWCEIAEWFFWDEFSNRFNFIAVDYLIYTREVLGNIRESFSITNILGTWAFGSVALIFVTTKVFRRFTENPHVNLSSRWPILPLLFIPVCSFGIQSQPIFTHSNNILNELSKNGIYEFFSAFRNNELDYKKLYANVSEDEMFGLMKKELCEKGFETKKLKDGRIIKLPAKEPLSLKPNLIFITVESLGSKFIGALGGQGHLTPYLDKLSEKSLFFSNIYATGTRTVRGLEALTLSLPPTPGASIVRRKNNEDMFSIGKILKKRKYDVKFIYGGHGIFDGIFDGMNNFFRKNGYEIVDRGDFESNEVTFSNVWGVADENLFAKVLKEANESYKNNHPFFSMVLTTSNHRPFTYPDGKIDIPSHTSRAGAVKYTDYAIGKFIEKAEAMPWFKNTVIVVVADHSTEGRGVIDIPVDSYHIPFWIYYPSKLSPQKVDRVASQIDVIPTVLSVMNMKYPSLFFGKNILNMTESDERFFVGTYQKVGLYHNGIFVSLGPKRTIETYKYDPKTKVLSLSNTPHLEIEKLSISYYQYASFLYKNSLYKFDNGD